MTRKKIGVAIIHGIGVPSHQFARPMIEKLTDQLAPACRADIEFQPIYWDPVLKKSETWLLKRAPHGNFIENELRGFIVDFVGDAIAYQIHPSEQRQIYDAIHWQVAQDLQTLRTRLGEDAPLCIIAHSLGTVITSNYFYDLQVKLDNPASTLIAEPLWNHVKGTAFERGETLALFCTMGSPLPLWGIGGSFDKPLRVPSPFLPNHHGDVGGQVGWYNFYDQNDVFAFPFKDLNDAYCHAVKEDCNVNVGNLLTEWNPLSHLGYWTDKDVVNPVARQLTNLWMALNSEDSLRIV